MSGEREQQLREQIIEGCREMQDVYLEIARDWGPASDETWDRDD